MPVSHWNAPTTRLVTVARWKINHRFDTLLHAADDVQLFKYIIKNTAWENGLTATFMPKPLFGDNGSACTPTCPFGKKVSPSSTTRTAMAAFRISPATSSVGILEHAAAVLAFTNPTINSYKRLVKGYEAPRQPGLLPGKSPPVCASH
ncbi:MAG: hypothetical protein U1U88_002318 [Lawsonella clevelandensis]